MDSAGVIPRFGLMTGASMRCIIGIAIMAISVVVAAVLFATGNLGSEQVARTTQGSLPMAGWHLTEVNFEPNWSIAVPIAACFVIGLLCAYAAWWLEDREQPLVPNP